MKKNQYIAAIACLVAGAIGFGSVFATEKAQERREAQEQAKLEQEQQQEKKEEKEEIEEASNVVEPKEKETQKEHVEEIEPSTETQVVTNEPVQETIIEEGLHFSQGDDLVWPLEGNVLLNYSMDSTIYFPTLDQYRYNPAIIIGGNVNSKVYIVAKGKITNIVTNEETGCTVTQDLGDGYSAVYGQLKELNFDVGDMVDAGQVIGYVSEPTKYYSVEGSNLYFELLKDGEPVNPLDYFE